MENDFEKCKNCKHIYKRFLSGKYSFMSVSLEWCRVKDRQTTKNSYCNKFESEKTKD